MESAEKIQVRCAISQKLTSTHSVNDYLNEE